jgi:Holliday junction DNA helicase RuvB
MRTLDAIEKDWHRKKPARFDVGDSVDVHVRIIEGDRERIQIFAGVVIAKRHEGLSETFAVRRMVQGEGVERIFPLNSRASSIVVKKKKGNVRRASSISPRPRRLRHAHRGEAGRVEKERAAVPSRREEGREGRAPQIRAAKAEKKPDPAALLRPSKKSEIHSAACYNPPCRGQSVRARPKFEDSSVPAPSDEFIGQRSRSRNLQVAIKAARKRKEALDHVLFSGLPGLGKTTLARLIAFEMKGRLHTTMGPILKRPGDLVGTLTKMEEGDILFIDECHRMLPDVEEFLYSAMEDYQISISMESGMQGRTITLPLKRFTLVGATTREGLLSEPFRARFGILEKLEWYPVADLVRILHRSAKILKTDIDEESAGLLGQRARGTPRVANRYLRRVRDLAEMKSARKITRPIALEALGMLGVDDAGLEEMDRKILKALVTNTGPVGLKTLAVAVGEEEGTIEEVYEPYLIQNNFLVRTSRGRKATEKAAKHLGAETVQDEQQRLF